MARQAINVGFPNPNFVNETGTRQAILPGVYLNETASNIYSVSIAETSAGTDTVTSATIFPSSLIDSVTSSDATNAVAIFASTVAEASATTDTVSSIATLSGTLGESANVSDTLSSAATLLSSLGESVVTSDTVASVATFLGSLSEMASTSDSISSSSMFLETLSETAGTSDTISAGATFLETLSEASSLSDVIAAAAIFDFAINESATPSDQVSNVASLLGFVIESATTDDTLSSTASLALGISESLSISDLIASLRITLDPVRRFTLLLAFTAQTLLNQNSYALTAASVFFCLTARRGQEMPFFGTFPPIAPAQKQTIAFDFGLFLPQGVTLTGTPTATISVLSGIDSAPQSRLITGPVIGVVPIVQGGSGLPSCGLLLQLGTCVAGVGYLIEVVCVRTDGDIAEGSARLQCNAPGVG